jgi:hypothetical protein
MAEIERLRKTREMMSRHFPLTAGNWNLKDSDDGV